MAKPVDQEARESLTDAQVECLLYDALRLSGELLPTTEEEIAQLEGHYDSSVSLPDSLKDARPIFRRQLSPASPQPTTCPVTVDGAIRENLARAAREGGQISPEVEERMRLDREAAERGG